jgi:hypothetical protein
MAAGRTSLQATAMIRVGRRTQRPTALSGLSRL